MQAKRLTPTYIYIRINGNNKRCQRTKEAAIRVRLNQEIKFLHYKKQQTNQTLYRLHTECANNWNNLWTILEHAAETGLTKEMETHYKHLNLKLDNLHKKQRKNGKKNPDSAEHQFYDRTINLTNIN
jgi:hypothetical protein